MLKTSPFNSGSAGSILGQEAKIPHASQPKTQNIKKKEYCNKFNKYFLNGAHKKKKTMVVEHNRGLMYYKLYVRRNA